MNGFSRDFLTRTGLAGNEGRCFGRRSGFDHAVNNLHGFGLADKALKALGRDGLWVGDHLLLDAFVPDAEELE